MNKSLNQPGAVLHRKAFVVDAHFDLPFDILNRRERGETKIFENRYHEGMVEGGVNLLVSAIFIEDIFLPEMGLRKALGEIASLHEDLDASPGLARICRSLTEVRSASEAGELALLLSLEGADPVGNDPGLLRVFYELGVRALGLTWSRRNYVADGSSFDTVQEGRQGGLTDFGIKLVKKAQHLGMLIDVSHLNDEGFWDVMKVAEGPVIASHSNCRALRAIPRNIADRQIEALAAKGGVMGINAISKFLHDDHGKATIEHLLDHVDHVAKVAGIEHVGLGLDLCDGFENWHSVPLGPRSKDVVDGHGKLPDVAAGLVRRGYSDEEVIKILGGNFLRVFEQIL